MSSEILPTAANSQPLLYAYRFIMCVVGIPINLFVVVAIIYDRELRSKPRNIFLAGIFASNLSLFVPIVYELINWELRHSEPVFSAADFLPYVLVLSNTALALSDRYLSMNNSEWYGEIMTPNAAGTIVVLNSILVTLFILPDSILCQMMSNTVQVKNE